MSRRRGAYDDPDTPPSSPIHFSSNNNNNNNNNNNSHNKSPRIRRSQNSIGSFLTDTARSISSFFTKQQQQQPRRSVTPPGTPNGEREEMYPVADDEATGNENTSRLDLLSEAARSIASLFAKQKATPANATATPPGTPTAELELVDAFDYPEARSAATTGRHNVSVTPPGTPTAELCNDDDDDIYDFNPDCARNPHRYANIANTSVTPPGTPTAHLELELEIEPTVAPVEPSDQEKSPKTISQKSNPTGFFEQIVDKLSMFSFRSAFQQQQQQQQQQQKQPPTNNASQVPTHANDNGDDEDDEDDEIKNIFEQKATLETVNAEEAAAAAAAAAAAGAAFTPPLLDFDVVEYSQEELKKSTFVQLASLNPHVNKSIDLSSLLGSLTALKRNTHHTQQQQQQQQQANLQYRHHHHYRANIYNRNFV